MTSEPLNQYTEICRNAIKSSSAKLSKTFESLLLEILLLYMKIQKKINFTQLELYGTPHIGTFWSGCASFMKHGIAVLGIAIIIMLAQLMRKLYCAWLRFLCCFLCVNKCDKTRFARSSSYAAYFSENSPFVNCSLSIPGFLEKCLLCTWKSYL